MKTAAQRCKTLADFGRAAHLASPDGLIWKTPNGNTVRMLTVPRNVANDPEHVGSALRVELEVSKDGIVFDVGDLNPVFFPVPYLEVRDDGSPVESVEQAFKEQVGWIADWAAIRVGS